MRLVDDLFRRLNAAANDICSCGGMGPRDEGVCDACRMYHSGWGAVQEMECALESAMAGESAALERVAALEEEVARLRAFQAEFRRLWIGEEEHAECSCDKCSAIRAALAPDPD